MSFHTLLQGMPSATQSRETKRRWRMRHDISDVSVHVTSCCYRNDDAKENLKEWTKSHYKSTVRPWWVKKTIEHHTVVRSQPTWTPVEDFRSSMLDSVLHRHHHQCCSSLLYCSRDLLRKYDWSSSNGSTSHQDTSCWFVLFNFSHLPVGLSVLTPRVPSRIIGTPHENELNRCKIYQNNNLQ